MSVFCVSLGFGGGRGFDSPVDVAVWVHSNLFWLCPGWFTLEAVLVVLDGLRG